MKPLYSLTFTNRIAFLSACFVSVVTSAATETPQPAIQKARKQADFVRKNQADFQKKLKDGKVLPFENLQKILPQLTKQTATLSAKHLVYTKQLPKKIEAADFSKHAKSIKELRASLTPLASYLQSADHLPTDSKLSEKKLDQLKTLNALDKGPASPTLASSKNVLKLTSPIEQPTLLFLPVEISVKAQPKSKIYFQAMAGGTFPNGLSVQEITADKNGNASTHWVSFGDSVGLANVYISSPSAVNDLSTRIKVLKPMLHSRLTNQQNHKNLKRVKNSKLK